ncbi:hypothetical protein HanRHA438_Chr01g0038731 [Helianthus annuus]|nr:hypothetical protein HanIR_Chr01g0041531 [Helianthus annuus]KAJ0949443.1 hypothetical protein HanRHA438_Chr01g0038731 [Helianthus annuus]
MKLEVGAALKATEETTNSSGHLLPCVFQQQIGILKCHPPISLPLYSGAATPFSLFEKGRNPKPHRLSLSFFLSVHRKVFLSLSLAP